MKTITIQHTVIEVSVEGTYITVEKDRTKNKSSHRFLPLVVAFEELLLQLKEQQERDRYQYKILTVPTILIIFIWTSWGIESSRDISHSIFRLFSKDVNCVRFVIMICDIVALVFFSLTE